MDYTETRLVLNKVTTQVIDLIKFALTFSERKESQ
jgi:hypothetical protein